MKAPLISIILPIYNVERFLINCLETISNQTYKNIEVILVVDGATDNSLNLANEYSNKDKRFSVIYQNNAGSGPARNNGIQHAKGDYIAFVDPDDWIDNDYIEQLLFIMIKNNVDLVLSGKTDNVFHNGNLYKSTKNRIEEIILKNKDEVRNKYIDLRNQQLLSAPTQKLFKKSIIDDYHIEFPDLRRSQDVVFNYRYYDKINSLVVIDYCGYQYRIEPSNYALRLPENYINTIKLIYNDIKELHKKWGVTYDESKAVIITNRVINAYIESLILRNLDFNFIFNDIEIIHIVKVAQTRNIYEKFMKYAIVHKSSELIKLNIKIKRVCKNLLLHL